MNIKTFIFTTIVALFTVHLSIAKHATVSGNDVSDKNVGYGCVIDAGSSGSNGAQGAAGSDASLPSGVIVIWSGSTGSIPSGWVLCNGSNSTPDLRDSFVVGAGSAYSVGNTGGSSSVTLAESQIPAHNHGISDPGHDHDTTVDGHHLFDGNGSQSIGYGGPGGYPAQEFELYNATTGISIQNAGGGGSHENRPPYYALAYIMKT